jgi:preprotein translocase subunit SecA
MSILSKIFGDANERYIKSLAPIVQKINSFEPEFSKILDEKLKNKTLEFKERLKNGETLADILPEAFALVREASRRALGQRHFDVQLIGGIILAEGKISEMRTGEGKTLTATLSLYLNALEGKGAHLVTVNDYLAKRDSVWMGQIFDLLGLTTACIIHDAAYVYDPNLKNTNEEKEDKERDVVGGFKVVESFLKPVTRKEAYLADITYGTNNEFGFDYLRDNMVHDANEMVQRDLHYAIVDEVDSILIDEARTPLIISAPDEDSTEKYQQFSRLISTLKEGDFQLDEKEKHVSFTEAGQAKIVSALGQDPWGDNDVPATHQLEAALKARILFKKDHHYVINGGQVIIVDEFTGRLMPGRRWSGGIHQAVEAKEGLKVQQESKTLATITFQNYFRIYKKLAGMTGTASTSAEEFDKVYKLEVVPVPTNKSMIRKDLSDKVYRTYEGKVSALVNEIKERHATGQPILVGTVSIEKNEFIGKLLEREGIPHKILNAKNHEKEGEIIAQAGKRGAVTIATNMAGRGVDIILGGNPPTPDEASEVSKAGGLHVIGTERHEARRIDNQLRGRAGRQGDAGSSQFFISMDDDLMRVFGGDRIKNLMKTLNFPEDQPLEAGLVTRAIESAQTKIEGLNFDARKHVLEYDDVMNKHREVFYRKRREILKQAKENNLSSDVMEIFSRAGLSISDYKKKEESVGLENMKQLEKYVYLRTLDTLWIDHLENMEYLRDSVGLSAYGQRDPLVEYKHAGHRMFKELLDAIDSMVARAIMATEIRKENTPRQIIANRPVEVSSKNQNVGRNDPCPCGSGKKFKKCHGK